MAAQQLIPLRTAITLATILFSALASAAGSGYWASEKFASIERTVSREIFELKARVVRVETILEENRKVR